jgi:hypothetical protein
MVDVVIVVVLPLGRVLGRILVLALGRVLRRVLVLLVVVVVVMVVVVMVVLVVVMVLVVVFLVPATSTEVPVVTGVAAGRCRVAGAATEVVHVVTAGRVAVAAAVAAAAAAVAAAAVGRVEDRAPLGRCGRAGDIEVRRRLELSVRPQGAGVARGDRAPKEGAAHGDTERECADLPLSARDHHWTFPSQLRWFPSLFGVGHRMGG